MATKVAYGCESLSEVERSVVGPELRLREKPGGGPERCCAGVIPLDRMKSWNCAHLGIHILSQLAVRIYDKSFVIIETAWGLAIFKEVKKFRSLVGTTPLTRSIKEIKLWELFVENCESTHRVPNWLRVVSYIDGDNAWSSSTNKSLVWWIILLMSLWEAEYVQTWLKSSYSNSHRKQSQVAL